jgi:glycosyltransferase involved in cell wall biosynthesis
MRILSAHNFYREAGGEDSVFAAESELLEQHGHVVKRYVDHNERIGRASLATAANTLWNIQSYKSIQADLRASSADLAHFHNTFPLISPAAYYAVQRAGIPVVQTLHNFRLICAGATFSRHGKVCEACVEQDSLLPAIQNRCYRGSRSATVALTAMLAVHRAAGTYQNQVDAYIALSEFARRKFIANGLPADRIFVKPNFVDIAPVSEPRPRGSVRPSRHANWTYALFAGRLAEEKGVHTLADAWRRLTGIQLQVAGDPPLSPTSPEIAWPSGVTRLGAQSRERVIELMRGASLLVFPSGCYENCPMTILEAFACGLPVVASDLGSIPEFVRHGYNGLLFRAGDPSDLAEKVHYAFEHPDELRAMGENARREFTEKYTAERNYKLLLAIYEQAIDNARRRKRDGKPANTAAEEEAVEAVGT